MNLLSRGLALGPTIESEIPHVYNSATSNFNFLRGWTTHGLSRYGLERRQILA